MAPDNKEDKQQPGQPASPSGPSQPQGSKPIPEEKQTSPGGHVGEGSGQDAVASPTQPRDAKPTTFKEQGMAPGKAGDVAEGKDPKKVQPEPPAVKPSAPVAVNEPARPQPGTPPASKGAAGEAKTPAPETHAAPAPPAGPASQPWEGEMVTRLKQRFGSGISEASTYLRQNYFVVDASIAHDVLRELRDREQFDYCVDVTCVHWPQREKPFDVVWILYSFARNERIRVKTHIGDGAAAPSVTDLWETANWLEREAFDMFGVPFAGHPDCRRILLPDDWKGHPLRKDYGIIQQDKEWVQIHLGIESGQ